MGFDETAANAVCIALGVRACTLHSRQGQETKAESPCEKRVRKRPGLRRIWKIVTTEGLLGKVASLVKSSLRQIRIEELEGDIRIELDDPADAGFVYAALGAAYPVLRLTRLNQVRIEPFLGEEVTVRGKARAVIRLQPIRLVIPLLKFVFSRPAFSAMKTAIAADPDCLPSGK